MARNRVIVLSIIDGGLRPADAARRYGVSRRWVEMPMAARAATPVAGSAVTGALLDLTRGYRAKKKGPGTNQDPSS